MIILGKYAVITFHHLLSKLDESCSYSKAIQLQHSLTWLEQIWLQIRGTLFPLGNWLQASFAGRHTERGSWEAGRPLKIVQSEDNQLTSVAWGTSSIIHYPLSIYHRTRRVWQMEDLTMKGSSQVESVSSNNLIKKSFSFGPGSWKNMKYCWYISVLRLESKNESGNKLSYNY